MAIVSNGFTPRLSTDEPVDVPRWDDPTVAPNFDTTVQPVSQDFATAMPATTAAPCVYLVGKRCHLILLPDPLPRRHQLL